jgi:hypothetical protein
MVLTLEGNMKHLEKTVAAAVLLTVSAAVWASPGLTPQQCNDYPFTQLKTEVTHKQLMNELAELEAVGYDPNSNDNYYPSELMAAQKKLAAEYRKDCAPSGGMPRTQYSATP